jgi:hypothetical protein
MSGLAASPLETLFVLAIGPVYQSGRPPATSSRRRSFSSVPMAPASVSFGMTRNSCPDQSTAPPPPRLRTRREDPALAPLARHRVRPLGHGRFSPTPPAALPCGLCRGRGGVRSRDLHRKEQRTNDGRIYAQGVFRRLISSRLSVVGYRPPVATAFTKPKTVSLTMHLCFGSSRRTLADAASFLVKLPRYTPNSHIRSWRVASVR